MFSYIGLQSKEKVAILSTKIVENQIENKGDLQLVQYRALSKHFINTGFVIPNTPNLRISELLSNKI